MDVTDVTGRFGPWQRRILLVVLLRGIALAPILLNIMFYFPNIDYWCARDEAFNVSTEEWRSKFVPPRSKCEKYIFDSNGVNTNQTTKCNACEFDSKDYGPNIKQEWSLVCDRGWLKPLAFSTVSIGNLVVYMFAGYLTDRFGRRTMYITGMMLIFLPGIFGIFSSSMEMFLATRFFVGICYGLFQSASLQSFVETVGPEYRLLMSLFFMGSFAAGEMLLAAVAYFVTDWKTLQLFTYFPITLIPLLLAWKFVPESARWLLSVGRYQEAKIIICEGARMNGITILDTEGVMEKLKEKVQEENQTDVYWLQLFRTKALRKLTTVTWLAMMFTVFITFGFTFSTPHLGGSLHLNIFLMGLTTLAANGILIIEAKYLNRKYALFFNRLFSGICFFATLAVPEDQTSLKIGIALLGKTANEIVYALLWLTTAEVCPTRYRAVGVNGAMMMGRIGSLFAPFIDELGYVFGKQFPMITFGVVSVVSSLLFLLLPDTRHLHLPDTVTETERLSHRLTVEKKIKQNEHLLNNNETEI